VVLFNGRRSVPQLSIRGTLAGKHILLIGVTGFIGKVWLVHLLTDLPEIGRIYLLIRRQGSNSAAQRFEKIVAGSPSFDALSARHGERLGEFLRERVEVIEGDVTKPDLGMPAEALERIRERLDVIVNSSGLTRRSTCWIFSGSPRGRHSCTCRRATWRGRGTGGWRKN
jgi:hypothetical protein